jgi:hypothetical protein
LSEENAVSAGWIGSGVALHEGFMKAALEYGLFCCDQMHNPLGVSRRTPIERFEFGLLEELIPID